MEFGERNAGKSAEKNMEIDVERRNGKETRKKIWGKNWWKTWIGIFLCKKAWFGNGRDEGTA